MPSKKSNRSESEEVQFSKSLSYLLRHGAQKEGVAMSEDGWVRVTDALAWANGRESKFNEEMVRAVVRNNEKQRFSLRDGSDGALEIRANQGHSVANVEVEMTPLTVETAPERAVHGTYNAAWPQIRTGGLNKMTRQHIHLARALPGESGVISGMRSSCQRLVWVDVRRAIAAAGIPFFESSSGVLLTPGIDGVLPAYKSQSVRRSCSWAFAMREGSTDG